MSSHYRGREGTGPFTFKHVPKVNVTEEDFIAAAEKAMGGITSENHLSEEQAAVFRAVCHWYEHDTASQQVLTLGGYAGTGKSTLVAVLANKYEGVRIGFLAFTGKAASVLRQKLRDANVRQHARAQTIHSALYKPVTDGRGRVLEWELLSELPYDLLVVDEASMVDGKVFEDLKSFDIPILAVGDHGQLPPVTGDFNLMAKPQLVLETIHRQAEGSPIISLSSFIRRFGALPKYQDNTQEVQYLGMDQLTPLIKDLYATHGKPQDLGLLCYTNETRVELNERVREARTPNTTEWSSTPAVGDQVICLRSLYGNVYNGMRGELTKVEDGGWRHYQATVYFPDDELEVTGPLCKAQFGRPKTIKDFEEYRSITKTRPRGWDDIGMLADYGYALTVHKSQGSSYEHTVVVAERPSSMIPLDDWRRWLYTAVTRCSKYLVVLQ